MLLTILSLISTLSYASNTIDAQANTEIISLDLRRDYTHVAATKASTNISSAIEWLDHAREDVRVGSCYQKVVDTFAECRRVDHTTTTQDWQTASQRYEMMITCEYSHPTDAYISAEVSHESSILSQGEKFCEDDRRVWVKLTNYISPVSE